MPQSSKDNQGGKTHAGKKTHSSGAVSEKAAAKKGGRSGASPTGPNKHGEKRTTPK
ncbi:hypothetical protein H8N03_00945 [Ramlibacter sp. USB13]|uniref:Uncharacterized protein n=1 Tax=Ramlibacter cellulosilyticus TaxID=2764187 RepID=A0A923MMN6_9BURK|nr:hypothetical protein [Ramlibacter cellulosilyticus]MBC5781488.1 hypothetical protein [Ramlibacter cellulosilyticus]